MTYTRQQALGYAKYAAENLRMPYVTVQAIINAYDWALHHRTPEEAEEHYLGGESDDRG